MSEHEHDDMILHLDELADLSERASNAHAVGFAGSDDNELDYERFGVCTADLLHTAQIYTRKTLTQVSEAGGGIASAMTLQFLAGFDIGYQARLEVETRELERKDADDG